MNSFLAHFSELLSLNWVIAIIHIIIIDIVLSWDNAIVIWLATRKLPSETRKKAIIAWVFGATILRLIFAFFAFYLLKIIGIQVAWALLLFYVVWKIYTEIRGNWWHNDKEKWGASGFFEAVKLIIIADVSMSLDNVLAVAGAAKENIVALGIGLTVSIVLMAFASSFIAKKLEQFPQIQWAGLLVILLVSVEMLLAWFEQIDSNLHLTIGTINFIGLIFFMMFLFAYKNIENLHLPNTHFLEKNKYINISFLLFSISVVIISLLSFFHIVQIHKNVNILYTGFLITIIFWIEYLWTLRKRKN